MTTSASSALPRTERQAETEPGRARYYRCRRARCPGSQVPAERAEAAVLTWLGRPRARLPAAAAFVVATYARIWPVLLPEVRPRVLRRIVERIEWNGRRCRVVLNDVGILEMHAHLRNAEP